MKIRRVMVVAKQTALEKLEKSQGRGAARMRRLISVEHASVDRIRPAHEEHLASLARVEAALSSRRIRYLLRNRPPKQDIRGYDLVVTVGGDGMLLATSHAVRNDTPVLGVNSSPRFSVGFLAGCIADDFDPTLDALASGELTPIEVQRLAVAIGKRKIREPVLNDVLFCANNPALVTRYRLEWPDGSELQRSSGVWIATPAGSTAALASAGGPTLPLESKRFAFVVREPYAPPGTVVRLRSAVLDERERLAIECRIYDASIFLDGSHRTYAVPFGETVTFMLGDKALRLVHRLDSRSRR